MFVTANKSLGAFVTSADYSHSLCVRCTVHGKTALHRLYVLDSYDAALAAYEAVVAYHDERDKAEGTYDEFKNRSRFAVRSAFDLNIEVGLVSDEALKVYAPFNVVARATAAMVRDEIKRTAAWALDSAGHGSTWAGLVKQTTESLVKRNIEVKPWQVEDALKSKCRIARCHECNRGRTGWFWKSSTKARVCDTRCPTCGARLYQTTLAFNARFGFIENPVGTFFSKSLDLLPGEKQADAEARHDRLHAAMEAI